MGTGFVERIEKKIFEQQKSMTEKQLILILMGILRHDNVCTNEMEHYVNKNYWWNN